MPVEECAIQDADFQSVIHLCPGNLRGSSLSLLSRDSSQDATDFNSLKLDSVHSAHTDCDLS